MAENSKIEWCGPTWNPIAAYHKGTGKRGWFCVHAHAGCKNCYAEGFNKRLGNGLAYTAQNADMVRWDTVGLGKPLKWRKPRRVFVDSMFDLGLPGIPRALLYRVFVVMALARRHTFLILTKHPKVLGDFLRSFKWSEAVEGCRGDDRASVIPRHSINDLERAFDVVPRFSYDRDCTKLPIPNVFIGTSPCDQKTADESIPDLLDVPAAGRFLSIEPLLGPVDLSFFPTKESRNGSTWGVSPLEGVWSREYDGGLQREIDVKPPWGHVAPRIHWVITGGESGPKARPMHPAWVRAIREQCVAARVPFFFKQWGACIPCSWDGEDDKGRRGYILAEEHCTVDYDVLGVGRYVALPDQEFVRFNHKKGGRLLDDRTWDEFPQVAS